MSATIRRQAAAQSTIVAAAASLLRDAGPGAVTTRAVARRAGVQPPAIYRLFGDKDGLLDAVAEHVMAEFVTSKAADVASAQARDIDPLEDLETGWRSQVEFALANPALFRLLSDPDRVLRSTAAQLGRDVLRARVHRVAALGRLRVSESRAVDMIQAVTIGAIQSLLGTPPERRDPDLPPAMFDAILREILSGAPEAHATGPTAAAVAFRAVAPGLEQLTDSERRLLDDWLARVIP